VITPHLDEDHADRVAALAARAREQLSARELAWGVRYGDVTLDNIHRTGRGLVLHDFDLAGRGWLAADLTGMHATGRWHAFAAGHAAERPLPDPEVIPWLEICALISNLRFHLVENPSTAASNRCPRAGPTASWLASANCPRDCSSGRTRTRAQRRARGRAGHGEAVWPSRHSSVSYRSNPPPGGLSSSPVSRLTVVGTSEGA
jgi:hypothetical protein